MKINKAKITAVLGILVLSTIAGLLVRLSLKNQGSETNSAFIFVKPEKTSAFKTPELRFPFVLKELKELSVLKSRAPEFNLKSSEKEKSSPNAAAPFFENINKAVKATEKSLAGGTTNDNLTDKNMSTVTPDGIILSLTKEQFNFLYPDYFIADLIDAQNLLIKQNDASYETILKIETDAQVRFVEEKIVATMFSADMITKNEADRFIKTIRFTLPELQLIDLEKYNYSFDKFSPVEKFLSVTSGGKNKIVKSNETKKLFFAELMKKLADVLSHRAQAVCGTCISLPLCFQEGAATFGIPGRELFYISCYCTGCFAPLGCLSANAGQAAIYDPVTGICGVGL